VSKWLDKILLLVAIVIAAAAAYYATNNSYQANARQTAPRGNQFVAELPSIETPEKKHWDEPAKQQDDWIFEVFTPPRVFFNQETMRFLVQLPAGDVAQPPPTEFGLEVVGIKRDPFRVQLTGYSGSVGYFRFNDQNERGRAKQVFEEAGIEVVSVEEERIVESDPENPKQTPRIRRQGVAVVKDLKDGTEYRLVSGAITNYAYPVVEAEVRIAETRESHSKHLRAGDVWEIEGAKYTLVSVDEENNSAVIKKELLDGSSPEKIETLKVMERIIQDPVFYDEYRDAPAPRNQQQREWSEPQGVEIEGARSRPPAPGEGMNVSTEGFFK
jgi:hypothetical protein